jgi:hypothetical protein
MKRVSDIVGEMPFAGRAAVETAALSAISERRSLKNKALKAGGAVLFLCGFAFMHGLQAKLGLNEVGHDLNDMQDGVNVVDVGRITVAGAYAAANMAVAYTQAQIGWRVAKNYTSFHQQVAAGAELPERNFRFKARVPELNELAFTMGAQTLFMAQMH